LGNPTKDLLDEMGRMERWLGEHATEGNGLGGEPIPVQGAVVFIHPNAQLEIEDSAVPVVTANKLKGWFRGQVKQQALSEARRQAVEALFEQKG
jgi:hypothetical protein